MATPFEKQLEIISSLYLEFRSDEDWADYFEVTDVAGPLAFSITSGFAALTATGSELINEAFEQLLDRLDCEDSGIGSLKDLLETHS